MKTLAISGKPLASPIWQAPMVGITDQISRELAYRFGCGLAFSEMIHARSLLTRKLDFTRWFSRTDPAFPVGIQLIGSDPQMMGEAAQKAFQLGADVIDVNMGCPKRHSARKGEGAALLRDLARAAKVLHSVVTAVACPVTVKLRLGWDSGATVAADFAVAAEACGVAAVILHPRYANSNYGVPADWSQVAKVVEQVAVPVIGNGDVWSPDDALRLRAETHCQGVMIGRGSIGNPWIYSRINALLAGHNDPGLPPIPDRFRWILYHLRKLTELAGDRRGIRQFRAHVSGYFRGLPGNDQVKLGLYQTKDLSPLLTIIKNYLGALGCSDATVQSLFSEFSTDAGSENSLAQ